MKSRKWREKNGAEYEETSPSRFINVAPPLCAKKKKKINNQLILSSRPMRKPQIHNKKPYHWLYSSSQHERTV